MNKDFVFPIAIGSRWVFVEPTPRLDAWSHATVHVVIQVGPGDLIITCAKAPESQPEWGNGYSFMGTVDDFLRSFNPVVPAGNPARFSQVALPFA